MNRVALATLLTVLLTVLLALTAAAPAWAGESVDGSGWSLVLPDGFTEAMSVEGSGSFKVTSRFGHLPIDGVPEIKAYTAGGSAQPTGMLMVARLDLSRPITSTDDLGLDQLESMRDQLPEGFEVHVTKVGEYHAIEASFVQETYDADMATRLLTVACGDYVVIVMLMTNSETYPSSAALWSSLKGSVKIDPPMNKLLLFGLIGGGALGGLWLLSRLGTRPIHAAPERASHFQRNEGLPVGRPDGLPTRPSVRPPTLPSSPPRFDESGSVPARVPSSPAVTRPAAQAPAARSGLRSTLPASGRWGDK